MVAALVALAATVRGDFSDTDGRILGTLAAVLYTGGGLFAGLATVERGRRAIGWALAGGAPVCFLLLLPAIWTFLDESGDDDAWQWAWTAVLALLAALMLATAFLLARGGVAERLAVVTGGLAGLAAASSIAAIWADATSGDGWIKVSAAAWILAVLAYVLVPVVGRVTASVRWQGQRVLATLDGVELVATMAAGPGFDPKLKPGERLLLRRTSHDRPAART